MKVAIPTDAPGGLEAKRSEHFGHCEMFTVIDFQQAAGTAEVSILQNDGHEAGGCMRPVTLLKDAGVDAVVVAGLGRRPMEGFNQVGIDVYYADPIQVPDVETALEKLQNNKLVVMRFDQACQGSANCNH